MSERTPSTALLAWIALLGNVVVIVQGAVVRATGSGAGCGSHWPSCNGQIVPLGATTETLIEFSHRLLSLAVLIIGAWLLRRAFRLRRENPGLFVFAAASFGFLIVEALLGGATVLFGLTGDNATLARGVMVAGHLVNSVVLIGVLTVTLLYASGRGRWPLRTSSQALLSVTLAVGLVGMLVLTFSGGIAAMGNTIFPSDSLVEGIAADFDRDSHPLIRLRVLHPLIAVTVGVYLFVSLGLAWWLKPVPEARTLSRALLGTYLIQLLIGMLNLVLLAPIVLQLLHLVTAVLAFALLSAVAVVMLGSPLPLRDRSRHAPVVENA